MTTNELTELCGVDDFWNGEMDVFDVGDKEILLVKQDDEFHAYQAICPHQAVPLIEGKFEDGIITCRAHLWQFDACSGKGVNPTNTCLKRYPVEIQNGIVSIRAAQIDDAKPGEKK